MQPRQGGLQSSADGWLRDPTITRLVKTRVDDAELVRARRAQFVASAVTIFSRKGYHATTTKEIARESGVSTGLIYQYVAGKEDILFLALQLITRTLQEGLPNAICHAPNPVGRFIAAYDVYCRVIDAHRDACMLTYCETKALNWEHREAMKAMELETNELIAGTIRECVAAGHFAPQTDVALSVYRTIVSAHTWALKYWRLSQITTLDDYVEANVEHLLNALLTEQGRALAEESLAILKSHRGDARKRERKAPARE